MLFDETDPESAWSLSSDEYLYYMNMAEVEWFAIDDTIRECSRKGLLLDPEISEESVKDKIEGILKKHNIYFEYEKDSGVFTVFGYK